MKKSVLSVIAVILLIALAAPALAAVKVDPYTMFVTKDGVKVYKKASTKAKVLLKLKRNQEILIDQESDGGKWYGVLVEGKDGEGQQLGWVQEKYLSATRLCDHDWSGWNVEREASCAQEGVRSRYCLICGQKQTEELEKLEHEYGNWKILIEPTCQEEGRKERTCTVCGYDQIKMIKKEEHEYGGWTVLRQPTCSRKGERSHTCLECDHEEVEEIDRLPHTFGDWSVREEPSCTAAGLRVRECLECGAEETRSIEMLEHQFGDWQISVAATDHSAGKRARYCRSCGLAMEEIYEPEGTLHRRDKGDAVREMQQLLVDQGYLSAGGADGTFGAGTEKALMRFQLDQGLEPDGVGWPQTLRRLRHEFGEWKTVKELTRSSDGERVRVCVDCGYRESEIIKAGKTLERRQRGEDVRTVQTMLNDMGYSAGTADGAYGPKLDAAYSAFAEANGMGFEPGKLGPGEMDALVNAWIAFDAQRLWKGQGKLGAPVSLMLTVTPDGDADTADATGMRTYRWTLTNLGGERCRFTALLLGYGDGHDFTQDNLVMAIDGIELRADGANTASGSFSVADTWGEGSLNFAAVATSTRNGEKWISNTQFFEGAEDSAGLVFFQD